MTSIIFPFLYNASICTFFRHAHVIWHSSPNFGFLKKICPWYSHCHSSVVIDKQYKKKKSKPEVWWELSSVGTFFHCRYCPIFSILMLRLSDSSDGKEFTCSVGDLHLIPGLGQSPGEGNSYSFQYSGLGNSMDIGAWQATVREVTKSQTWLSDFHFHIANWWFTWAWFPWMLLLVHTSSM